MILFSAALSVSFCEHISNRLSLLRTVPHYFVRYSTGTDGCSYYSRLTERDYLLTAYFLVPPTLFIGSSGARRLHHRCYLLSVRSIFSSVLICCVSVCSGRTCFETAERICLKFCTKTEVCPGTLLSHFGGHCSRDPASRSDNVPWGSYCVSHSVLH